MKKQLLIFMYSGEEYIILECAVDRIGQRDKQNISGKISAFSDIITAKEEIFVENSLLSIGGIMIVYSGIKFRVVNMKENVLSVGGFYEK